jgi:hypothetical protein
MKYKKEIDSLIKTIWDVDHLTDAEYEQFVVDLSIDNGFNIYKKMEADIEEGLTNGVSVEDQIKLVKQVIMQSQIVELN